MPTAPKPATQMPQRSAAAAERSADAVERQAKAAEAGWRRPPRAVAGEAERLSGSAYAFRNVGTETG